MFVNIILITNGFRWIYVLHAVCVKTNNNHHCCCLTFCFMIITLFLFILMPFLHICLRVSACYNEEFERKFYFKIGKFWFIFKILNSRKHRYYLLKAHLIRHHSRNINLLFRDYILTSCQDFKTPRHVFSLSSPFNSQTHVCLICKYLMASS